MLHTSCTTRPLLQVLLRGGQVGQAVGRAAQARMNRHELLHAARVDDVDDVGDGHGGLRDVRREHNLHQAMRGLMERSLLLLLRDLGVQKAHFDPSRDRALGEPLVRGVDGLPSWEERQNGTTPAIVALVVHDVRDHPLHEVQRHILLLVLHVAVRPHAHQPLRVLQVVDVHREEAARDLDHGKAGAEVGRPLLEVHRRRHEDHSEARRLRQQQPDDSDEEVGVEIPLVDLVDDEVADAVQAARDQAPQKHTSGHVAHRGIAPRHPAGEAHLVADTLADRLPALLGHALRHGDGRDSAGLRADDVRLGRVPSQRGALQNHLRQLRRLTATGGASDENDGVVVNQVHDVVVHGCDRQLAANVPYGSITVVGLLVLQLRLQLEVRRGLVRAELPGAVGVPRVLAVGRWSPRDGLAVRVGGPRLRIEILHDALIRVAVDNTLEVDGHAQFREELVQLLLHARFDGRGLGQDAL
mmetsp:Transcript_77693/g.202221  ORF Transcript_77693/g.202221 Transcript_77693/m.202221 type:complete len:470 (+) Transcript_77693:1283-2692(+)